MSCSKKEESSKDDTEFEFLKFIWSEEWENMHGEQCICSQNEDDLVAIDHISENRHPGEVAVEIGFTNMGICKDRHRNALISQWREELREELGKDFVNWLSDDIWHTYIYYKFMSWRILQALHTKRINKSFKTLTLSE